MRRNAPATPTPSEVFRSVAAEPRIAILDGRAALDRSPWSLIARRPERELRIEHDGRLRVSAPGQQIAAERGAFEGIYRTARDVILEGTTSNVFEVRCRSLASPPASGGVLPGVTRQKILVLADEAFHD